LTAEQLYEYIKDKDHGLYFEQKEGSSNITAYYKPSCLVAYNELLNQKGKEDSILNLYRNNYYFIVSISLDGQDLESVHANAHDYGAVISELSFSSDQWFSIDSGDKLIKPMEVVFPRNYGMSPASSFMLVFDKKELHALKTFKLKVNYPGTTNTSFIFNQDDIKKTPSIKI